VGIWRRLATQENAWIHQAFSVGNGCVWIALWRPPDGRFRWANGAGYFQELGARRAEQRIGAEEDVVLYVEDRRHSETASPPAPRDLHPNLHLGAVDGHWQKVDETRLNIGSGRGKVPLNLRILRPKQAQGSVRFRPPPRALGERAEQ